MQRYENTPDSRNSPNSRRETKRRALRRSVGAADIHIFLFFVLFSRHPENCYKPSLTLSDTHDSVSRVIKSRRVHAELHRSGAQVSRRSCFRWPLARFLAPPSRQRISDRDRVIQKRFRMHPASLSFRSSRGWMLIAVRGICWISKKIFPHGNGTRCHIQRYKQICVQPIGETDKRNDYSRERGAR